MGHLVSMLLRPSKAACLGLWGAGQLQPHPHALGLSWCRLALEWLLVVLLVVGVESGKTHVTILVTL